MRPPEPDLAVMDELAAAAAVVAISNEDFAEDPRDLEETGGSRSGADLRSPSIEASESDTENDGDLPELFNHEAANPKVWNAPIIPRPHAMRPAIHSTWWYAHVLVVRLRRRWQSMCCSPRLT